MQFQITTDYAIRVVMYLHLHRNELVTGKSMSQQLGITYQYFMKVADRLRQANIIQSVQGCNGGYQLVRDASQISVYDIVLAIEGDIRINRCLNSDEYCSRNATCDCPVRVIFQSLQEDIINNLKSQMISEVIENQEPISYHHPLASNE